MSVGQFMSQGISTSIYLDRLASGREGLLILGTVR